MMNIVMICPLSSQPRIHRRALKLNKLANLTVYGFKRKVYEQNSFSPAINYTSLGNIDDGRYLSRIFKIINSVFKIRKEKPEQAFYYALSIDCLVIARLAGIKHGFYEIGDLRSVERRGSFYAKLEAWLIRRTSGVVITSPHFYDRYFNSLHLPQEKFITIKNKLLTDEFESARCLPKLLNTPRIRIGLIGLLRYKEPIVLLINFIERHSDKYTLECFGDGPYKDLIANSQSEAIRFHGNFKCPDDLPRIYQQIDLNYVVYDNTNENVRLAIPNKLFESVYFGIPIICARNTALADEVSSLAIGVSVDTSEPCTFDFQILDVNPEQIIKWSTNAMTLPQSYYSDDSEEKIEQLLSLFDEKCGDSDCKRGR